MQRSDGAVVPMSEGSHASATQAMNTRPGDPGSGATRITPGGPVSVQPTPVGPSKETPAVGLVAIGVLLLALVALIAVLVARAMRKGRSLPPSEEDPERPPH